MTDHPEQADFDADVLLPAISPHVLAAVDAAARGNVAGISGAWCAIILLGERAIFMALTALGDMAVVGVKIPEGALGPMPVIVRSDTGEPVDPDAPEHAAAAFAGRFCAAAATKDRALQRDLLVALVEPAVQDEPDPAFEERVADAFTMIAQCAAEGVERERVRRRRNHQHPRAPRRSHH